jgi:hypothetical protein
MNFREWIISVAIWLGRNAMKSKITKVAKKIYVHFDYSWIRVYPELEQEILC